MGLKGIRRLASAIVPAQDRALGRAESLSLDERVAALRDARRIREERARQGRRRGAAALAVTAVAVATGLFVSSRPSPLRFEVGALHERGIVGDRVEALRSEPLPIHFSDGTEMMLAESASARVVSLEPRGAHVVVEQGTLHASVVPRPAGAWVVAVGPFDVHVKGTRFDASWDAKRDSFTLKMYEGSVVVVSRCLPAPRTSVAGEVLELSCATPMTGPAAPASAPPPNAAPALTPEPAAAELDPPGTADASTGAASNAARSHRAWRALLARGDARGALALLAQSGDLDEACAHGSEQDLMQLGDAARSAGGRERAVRIYRAVRSRFANSDRATIAAFHLGQVAFDQGGSLEDARSGFESYLAERPDGPLAQEALGRLLEIEQRGGATGTVDPAGRARSLAERYLERFPHGPHAALARSMVAP